MKKLILVILCAATSTVASAAVYVGASAGYLLDGKEMIYSGRFGLQVAKTLTVSHNLELEYLFSSQDASDGFLTLEGDFNFLMANYRLVAPIAPKVHFTGGVGGGTNRIKISGSGSGVPSLSDSDSTFAWQAFAGLNFTIALNVDLSVGARYIKITDATLFGDKVEIGDDTAIEAGVHIRF